MLHRNVDIFQKNTQHYGQEDRIPGSLLTSEVAVSHFCILQYKVGRIFLLFIKILSNKKVLLPNQGS
jgi:hypothetical protein